MALSDPQTVTIAETPHSLPRVASSGRMSEYSDLDAGVDLIVSHVIGKRRRTMVKIHDEKIAPDPLTAVNKRLDASVHLVIDSPLSGEFTRTELKDIALALTTWLSESSAANLLQVLGEEH